MICLPKMLFCLKEHKKFQENPSHMLTHTWEEKKHLFKKSKTELAKKKTKLDIWGGVGGLQTRANKTALSCSYNDFKTGHVLPICFCFLV